MRWGVGGPGQSCTELANVDVETSRYGRWLREAKVGGGEERDCVWRKLFVCWTIRWSSGRGIIGAIRWWFVV